MGQGKEQGVTKAGGASRRAQAAGGAWHGQPLAADLFCGAGGIAEGFRQAGYRIGAGTDADPDACATFAKNFPEAAVIHGDIRERRIREHFLEAAAGVQAVVGGPPCQAFSQVRNHARLIDDPRNSLYREFVRSISLLEPPVFLMENVPGLDQMGIRRQVLQDLSLRGAYRVNVQLLDAADFGVPQTRKRIVFIGIHESLGIEPPVIQGTYAVSALQLTRRNGARPTHYEIIEQRRAGEAPYMERLLDPTDASIVTAEQALGDLVSLRAGERRETLELSSLDEPRSRYQTVLREGAAFLANTSVPRINKDTLLRLAGVPHGGNFRDLSPELLSRYITGELWGPHNGSGRLGRKHFYAYRKLHPHFWSWTLNTKADSVYHYDGQRCLSVREFARLQSFPDRFVFTTDPRPGMLLGRIDGGAAHSRYRQVGNAVPPLLARAIAGALNVVLIRTGLRTG
ncbi:MAG TPA: DNA (cytosine-5-)-methyltransferase [Thermoanaerobaculia bacterium]|nr:DNA (cytosine-5-)-methyltransferase [Thermoanaerobaculia bacterium]